MSIRCVTFLGTASQVPTRARNHNALFLQWDDLGIPPPGSPNVVVVLLDDTGFAHFGCYGGPIDTPNIDALAADGLRFTNFHVTPVCSPTRASLLTGRNHHSVGMRTVANFDTGFPNSRGVVPASAGNIAEIVLASGAIWRFSLEGARLSLEESTFFADSAGPRSAMQIVARGATFGESEVRWVVEAIA